MTELHFYLHYYYYYILLLLLLLLLLFSVLAYVRNFMMPQLLSHHFTHF